MFFDTNVIIMFLDKAGDTKIADLVLDKSLNGEAYISGIVLAEVLAYQGYDDGYAKEVEDFLKKTFIVCEVSQNILVQASSIARNKRRETSKKLKLTDAIIISTAIENNKELLTFDREDFKNIKDIKLFEL